MSGESTTSKLSSLNVVVALSTITAAGACVRFLFLGRKSFWWDEVATAQICISPWHEFWAWIWRREANMVFYYVLMRQWIHLGDSEVVLRSLSVLFAIISIPLIYFVAVEAFGTR